ncbi:hypothetical protein ACOMHN_008239 [Nucella lapillus]
MAEERVLFRQRFEEGLDGTTSNSYMLPDVEMHQSMVDELAQSSKKAYYLKQKFEMIQIAGRKKIIKLFTADVWPSCSTLMWGPAVHRCVAQLFTADVWPSCSPLMCGPAIPR